MPMRWCELPSTYAYGVQLRARPTAAVGRELDRSGALPAAVIMNFGVHAMAKPLVRSFGDFGHFGTQNIQQLN